MWGRLFSRLYEELGLLGGGLTPWAEETLARLSTWMPYESARELLGVQVSKAITRRTTLATGEAALAVCEAEVEELKQEVPQASVGADKQAMSGDGAFVHLVGGEWAEVKTLAIGEVTHNRRGKSARSSSRTARAWLMRHALSTQRCSKRIGEDWNGPARCAQCKMERSGCKDWWTTTVPMRCASSILCMPPSISTISGRGCRQ